MTADGGAGRAEGAEEDERPGLTAALGAGAAGAAVVLFILLRIMAVAHWDWFVAGEVADSMDFSDLLGVVLGTLFGRPHLTAVGVMCVAPLALADLYWYVRRHRRATIGRLLLVAFLAAAVFALTTTLGIVWLPVGIAFLTAIVGALSVWWMRGATDVVHRLFRLTGGVALVLTFAFSALVDTPWQLREHIEMEQGIIDGYVLEVTPGFVRVLTEEPREVKFLLTSQIKSRTIVE
ncbi:hypothetical protein [Tessaracoccus sp. OH4464_COT-324]|uniref:hypothetical protein n=1 Tax=Tessaracoccus sp. OH4464_COT-324 TaxID=2491059 RepID=UPI000F63F22B|nr:hypothetical protein [Tessaracoccus sp. OH4464_COT-324]RRD46516.1 hypothetical protein EII42_06895 [Tessaracoccus sp. OH4464_COT-324]